MSHALLESIELERHLSLLRGADCDAVAICDAQGRVITGWQSAPEASIEPLLSELGEDALRLAPADAELRVLPVGRGRELLQAPIFSNDESPAGWLNALRASGEEPVALKRRIRDTAKTLSTELQLNEEVRSLVGELGARYEELNLVYQFEERTRAFTGSDREVEATLASFAEHLNLDVISLVIGDRVRPIFSAKPGRIIDLDLLLTQLRGDVFRFVSVSREPLLLSRPNESLRSFVFANLPYHLVACPVFLGTQPAMLAMVRSERETEFTNSDRNLASMIAGHAALVLRNSAMHRRLETFSAQMAATLIEAIEAKDPYTRGHSERVQTVSVELGQAAAISSEVLESISWGALLHDVGKIGVPDAILCKRGSLSREEYTLIKIHPERSYEILRHVEGLSEAALSAARYHQEKFDGTGYPHGLRGGQIPYEARLVAVADTYDAITSSRSYRPGVDHEEALRRIRGCAGAQLDPDLVSLFERVCEDRPVWLRSPKQSKTDG